MEHFVIVFNHALCFAKKVSKSDIGGYVVLALVLSILHGRASKVLAFIEHENPFSIHPVVAGERELLYAL